MTDPRWWRCGGTITRTWNVSDACGNPAVTRTQIITVDDNTAPVLAAAPVAVTVECIEDVPAMISLAGLTIAMMAEWLSALMDSLVGGACGGTITQYMEFLMHVEILLYQNSDYYR